MQYLFFYDCLILFSIMSSRFICVVSYCRSFFFQTKYVCVYHIFFIHSSVNGHLGHFSVLVIASCNKHGNTIFFFFFEILISILLVKYSKVGVQSHMIVLFLIFKGNSILLPKYLHHFAFSIAVPKDSIFSTFWPTLVFFFFFW